MGQSPRRRAHLPGPDPLTTPAQKRRHWASVWIQWDDSHLPRNHSTTRPHLHKLANWFVWCAITWTALFLIATLIRMVLA